MTPELVSLLNTYTAPTGLCDELGNWIALNSKLQRLLAPDLQRNLAAYLPNDTDWENAWNAICSHRQIQLVDTNFCAPLEHKLAKVTRVDFLNSAGASYLIEFYARIDAKPAQHIQPRTLRGVLAATRGAPSRAVGRGQPKALSHTTNTACETVSGLPGRDALERQLHHQWKLALCQRTALSLLLIDVAFEPAGEDPVANARNESAVQLIARCLQANVGRWSDYVAQTGATEFGILLPGTDADGLIALAERLLATLDSLQVSKSPIGTFASVSIGSHSCRPTPEARATALVERAESALRSALGTGDMNRVLSADRAPADIRRA